MNCNMKEWVREVIDAPKKKAIPVLSFPAVQLLGISVKELISDSDTQARGMLEIAKRCPSGASVSMMDLSVEAEAFGAEIEVLDDEIPRVVGPIVSSMEEAENLQIPAVGTARTGAYIEAIQKVAEALEDRPVFAGTIGPFSLAGRLMDMSKIMLSCRRDPALVTLLVEKATAFLIEYIKAYKAAGANGVVIAEPAAGLLAPKMMKKFSCDYCRQIIEAVQDESFIVIYHNCGESTAAAIPEIIEIGAAGVHFGDAVKIENMVAEFPADMLVMGNVSPSVCFLNGTPELTKDVTKYLLETCGKYPNFVISSGCDIPPMAPWANIDAFFEAAER